MGLYQPSSGHILVDGIDIAQIDPFELRKHIGYIPQDITLWKGTLKYNILAGDMAISDDFFSQICDIAGVLDFVRLHPLGFNMPINEDGSGLSQGQKQSLAIARALVRNPKILLMDEPTANMDPQSEHNFLMKLQSYLTDQTVIMITHRMNVLALVNRVVVIEQGQVLMDGPKEGILNKLKGIGPSHNSEKDHGNRGKEQRLGNQEQSAPSPQELN
jgi:ATP-binding cassette subfamily C protein LapB